MTASGKLCCVALSFCCVVLPISCSDLFMYMYTTQVYLSDVDFAVSFLERLKSG